MSLVLLLLLLLLVAAPTPTLTLTRSLFLTYPPRPYSPTLPSIHTHTRLSCDRLSQELELREHSLSLLQERLQGSEAHKLAEAVAAVEAELADATAAVAGAAEKKSAMVVAAQVGELRGGECVHVFTGGEGSGSERRRHCCSACYLQQGKGVEGLKTATLPPLSPLSAPPLPPPINTHTHACMPAHTHTDTRRSLSARLAASARIAIAA
jgi:hypothetical protein